MIAGLAADNLGSLVREVGDEDIGACINELLHELFVVRCPSLQNDAVLVQVSGNAFLQAEVAAGVNGGSTLRSSIIGYVHQPGIQQKTTF